MVKHSSEARTETLVLDLLNTQGWSTNRPPQGCVVRQNEYKSFLELEEIFRGKSKSGNGDGYPDFLIISKSTYRPQMVIEAKADDTNLEDALSEAIHYGDACREAGHPVIAVGIITEFEQAEAIVGTGDADVIALARTILYNPRWPWHAAAHFGAHVKGPAQYLRSQPRQYPDLFNIGH